jgi:hypothetical protein
VGLLKKELPGRERAEGEYQALFDNVGLELSRVISTPSPFSNVEGVSK